MAETTITPDDSHEEPKAQVKAAPLNDSEIEMLKAAGMYNEVDAKDYQTNPNLAKAMMGNKPEATTEAPKVVGGGNDVFTPSDRYQKHQEQLNQTQTPEPEKRQYVHGMKFEPEAEAQTAQAEPVVANQGPIEQPQAYMPFDPNAGIVETMTFDGLTDERPVDNSQAVNSSLNKSTAQLVTDGLWGELYPWGMKKATKIPTKEIMEDPKLPFSLKDKLLQIIYRQNAAIEKNCYQSPKHIKEFQDALTLVLESYGFNQAVGPEGQLIYALVKLCSVGWGQYQDNRELNDKTVMQIQEEIKKFTDEQDRKEAQKSQTETKKAA